MELIKRIKDILAEMDDSDILLLWNDWYCDAEDRRDDEVYEMYMFSHLYEHFTPLEIAHLVYDGNFSPDEPYFKSGWNGLESSIRLEDLLDLDALAKFIVWRGWGFGFERIENALKEEA